MERLGTFVMGVALGLFVGLAYIHFSQANTTHAIGFLSGQVDMAQRFCPAYVEHMVGKSKPK